MTRFEKFKGRIERELFQHPVIVANPYTRWFRQGRATAAQVRDLIEQFAVFSNEFLVIQTKRMVNADSLEGERQARFILVNECGVGLNSTNGSAEGKTFHSGNAHLNWLREIGAQLGLDPVRMGKWDTGVASTHEFLEGLDRTYGSRDGRVGAAASFAIECWAAFGIGEGFEREQDNFWQELITGLKGFNERRREESLPEVSTSFFDFHFVMESGHGAGVWLELEQAFKEPGFDEELFIRTGKQALRAIETFWNGLERRRQWLERSVGLTADGLVCLEVGGTLGRGRDLSGRSEQVRARV